MSSCSLKNTGQDGSKPDFPLAGRSRQPSSWTQPPLGPTAAERADEFRGAGKTNFLCAFRHYLHSRGLGWFTYLQMTTSISHYPRYILRNLVESLSQPYDLSRSVNETGWLRLSNFLAEHPSVPAALREGENGSRSDACSALPPTVPRRLARHA